MKSFAARTATLGIVVLPATLLLQMDGGHGRAKLSGPTATYDTVRVLQTHVVAVPDVSVSTGDHAVSGASIADASPSRADPRDGVGSGAARAVKSGPAAPVASGPESITILNSQSILQNAAAARGSAACGPSQASAPVSPTSSGRASDLPPSNPSVPVHGVEEGEVPPVAPTCPPAE